MNIKNAMFSLLMVGTIFSSSFVTAGIPTQNLELDKAAVTLASGTLGAGAVGILGAQKGAALGATLGAAGGPVGAVLGGAVGAGIGFVAGGAAGYAGYVMTKAFYNDVKRRN